MFLIILSYLLNYILSLQATEDKNTAIAQAEKTATKAKLADRLINGLAGEFKRWSDAIHQFAIAEGALDTPSKLLCIDSCHNGIQLHLMLENLAIKVQILSVKRHPSFRPCCNRTSEGISVSNLLLSYAAWLAQGRG